MKEIKYMPAAKHSIMYMPAAKHSIYWMNGNSIAKATSLRNKPAQKIK
jgi:hypothetical protein